MTAAQHEKPEPQPEPKVEKEREAEIVTIQDFKSMLVGMDLVLGDNWTPTEDQWVRIRKKLDALIETAEQRPGGAATSFPPVRSPVDSPSSVSESDLLKTFPATPGGVPENIPIDPAGGPSGLVPPKQQQPQPVQRGPAPPMARSEGEQVKTPDIDSSQGYKSSFV